MSVFVVGGPAGTGKSTLASLLANHFSCPFVEGDELHPPSNVQKMSLGQALTDEDRWDWLAKISQVASERALDPQNPSKIAIISCSMLKKIYRDHIKESTGTDKPIKFKFVFLYTTFEELINRVNGRKGHFMKSDMVETQYKIMEIPEKDDEGVPIDSTGKSPEEILKEVIADIGNL